MQYSPLYEMLPNLAGRETKEIVIIKKDFHKVPAGTYGLMEMYCTDKRCDCRRVFINVISEEMKKPLALITFGWESEKFYADWYHLDWENLTEMDRRDIAGLKGPCLNMSGQQSRYAQDLLTLVTQMALTDPDYVDRLKRHYKLFKLKLHSSEKWDEYYGY